MDQQTAADACNTKAENIDVHTAERLAQAIQFHQSGQLAQAQALYREILQGNPQHSDSLYLLGLIEIQTGNSEQAVLLLSQAVTINPHSAPAYNNLAIALTNLKHFDQALINYDRAIAIDPSQPDAHINKGQVLAFIRRLDEALACYNRLLELQPNHAQAYCYRGDTLLAYNRLEEALADYNRSVALKPDFLPAYLNRASVLSYLQRLDESLADYAKVLELDPTHDFIFGTYLYLKMQLCNWDSFAEIQTRYLSDIFAGNRITRPFPSFGLLDDPALHRLISQIFVNIKYPNNPPAALPAPQNTNQKIRIGYYSADFHNHPTAHLMAGLFEQHNKERFEIYAFCLAPTIKDPLFERLYAAFDHYFDVSTQSDTEVVQLSRQLTIDIAVDLKGYTKDSRPNVFIQRCAPIQASYLGYPGTMALSAIDYLIADKTIVPAEYQCYYTEKLVYLPHSYQVNDTQRPISPRTFSKKELGLPEQGFVFCCFNSNYKILPDRFSLWIRLLKKIDGSVLWLLEDHPQGANNLRQYAISQGIDGNRLIFAPHLKVDEHLARHRLADLFLDTLPYNAHTTASDALWAGLPVLTRQGRSFAGRVAASLLNALNLPELITDSDAEYEAKALELATNPDKLAQIKDKLAQNRLTAPLFNTRLFTRHLEMAYKAMVERAQQGLAPEVIEVVDTTALSPATSANAR